MMKIAFLRGLRSTSSFFDESAQYCDINVAFLFALLRGPQQVRAANEHLIEMANAAFSDRIGRMDTINKLIAVIPAHNEAEHISQVVSIARQFLPVLVVDDGSGDDTAHLAEASGAEVLRQVPNQGKGSALRAGFRRALNLGCEVVITLDGDGQHDPIEIPKFLQAYAIAPADLIIGQRNFSDMPFVRRLANTSGRWLFSWAMGRSIPDNQSGYRMLSSRLMEYLLNSTEQGFEFEVEMLAICVENRFILHWIPIQTIYSGEASHIRPWKHLTNFIRIAWNIHHRRTMINRRRT